MRSRDFAWWFVPVAGALALACQKPVRPPPAPVEVLVAQVRDEDLRLFVEEVGTLEGFIDAEIRARVPGVLLTQNYDDGATVKKGQLLFTIDPAQYQAAVQQARGALRRAEAGLGEAKKTVARDRPLVAKQAVSQQDLDDARANLDAAAASVESAKAALEEATLNLSYCRLASPVDGLAGVAQVRPGNLVGQGDPTLLTTVSRLDPIRAIFPVSELEILRLSSQVAALEKLDALDAGADRRVLDLVLADDSVYPRKGWLATVGRNVTTGTGTFQVEAYFPNPDGLLRPGSYARVRIPLPQDGKPQLVVPQQALRQLQGTYSVGVVGLDDVVHFRPVTLGPQTERVSSIVAGLRVGDRVITEGLQMVVDGSKVVARPDPSVAVGRDGGR